jgi:DnaJ-class molecular chaperone
LAIQPKRDYYEVLGVDRSASEQEIKDAFLKVASEFQAAGKPKNIEAVERFREIARAFRVLGDPAQRGRYDRLGETGLVSTPIPGGYDLEQLDRLSRMGLDPLQQLEPWIVEMVLNSFLDLS